MELSVIIVNWNTRDLLRACLESVRKHTVDLEYEIIVVDNGSTDGSTDMVREQFLDIILIENSDNRGFAVANNQGIRIAKGNAIILLNSDTELLENSLLKLYQFLFSDTKIGGVGGRLIYPGGSPQWSYGWAPSLGRMLWITVSGLLHIPWGRKPSAVTPQESEPAHPVEYIVGADLMLKRAALDQIGLLDETFFAYFEETDLCIRMGQAGYELWYTPITSIIHRIGSSFGAAAIPRLTTYYTSLFQYLQKHRGGYRIIKWYLSLKFKLGNMLDPNDVDKRASLTAIKQATVR